jgi:pimeloyl-ACP methyl ester carboxylesterase
VNGEVARHVPEDCPDPSPLLILLHGNGRNGQFQIDIWRDLADKEKIILVAPTSLESPEYLIQWRTPRDSQRVTQLIRQESLRAGVDSKRVYLVGNSLGGVLTLRLALASPNQIAAAAVHSPTFDLQELLNMRIFSTRRAPIGVWVGGENDCNHHWGTTDLPMCLEKHKAIFTVIVIPEHRHADYNTDKTLPPKMWDFLKDKTL